MVLFVSEFELKILDEQGIEYLVFNSLSLDEGKRIKIAVKESQAKTVKSLLHAA